MFLRGRRWLPGSCIYLLTLSKRSCANANMHADHGGNLETRGAPFFVAFVFFFRLAFWLSVCRGVAHFNIDTGVFFFFFSPSSTRRAAWQDSACLMKRGISLRNAGRWEEKFEM